MLLEPRDYRDELLSLLVSLCHNAKLVLVFGVSARNL